MKIDWGIVAIIAAPLISLFVGAALDRYFNLRPRLIGYLGHTANFKIQQENQEPIQVYTHSVVLRNAGKKSVSNTCIVHKIKIPNINIEPSVEFLTREGEDGSYEIKIPKIVPNEQFTISYLYFYPWQVDQIHSYIKSDEGLAKIISVIPQQQFPKWVGYTMLGLAVVGSVSILYVIYNFAF